LENELGDPAQWVEQYGSFLYRYSLIRVRNDSTAEDLVQETLLAAYRNRNSFKGQSTEKTWLTGILKHKIIDYYRKTSRQDFSVDKGDDLDIEQFFTEKGQVRMEVKSWAIDPAQSLENNEFWVVLQNCIGNLPSKAGIVFSMRELDGMSTEEICKELGSSPTNLWVILHRARLGLRKCLENKWFQVDAK